MYNHASRIVDYIKTHRFNGADNEHQYVRVGDSNFGVVFVLPKDTYRNTPERNPIDVDSTVFVHCQAIELDERGLTESGKRYVEIAARDESGTTVFHLSLYVRS